MLQTKRSLCKDNKRKKGHIPRMKEKKVQIIKKKTFDL